MCIPQFNYHMSLLYLSLQTNKNPLLEVLPTFAVDNQWVKDLPSQLEPRFSWPLLTVSEGLWRNVFANK